MEVKVRFVFPKLEEEEQDVFLSDDFNRIIILGINEARVYELEAVGIKGIKRNLKFIGRMPRLPLGICDGDPFQMVCLFSPDFTMHLDIDPVDQTFLVRVADTGKVHFKIP